MAGLWSVRKCGSVGGVLPAVWPCARPCALVRPSGERFHGCCVGRPAVLDPVGWGTPPPHPRGRRTGPGGELAPPGLCVAGAGARACTGSVSRRRVLPAMADLAENRRLPFAGCSAPTRALERPMRSLPGSGDSGGAFASQITAGTRAGGSGASRTPRRMSRFSGSRLACGPCPNGATHSPVWRMPTWPRDAAPAALAVRVVRGSMASRSSCRRTGCPQPVEAAMRWLVGWSSTAAGRPGSARRAAPERRRDRAPGGRPTPVGRPRSALGGRRLAPRRGPRRQGRRADPDRRPRHLRRHRRPAAGRPLRRARRRTAPPHRLARQLHRRRPGRPPHHRRAATSRAPGPVFHTPWAGGTAYATAALPLADLIEASLDFGHLAAAARLPPTYRPRRSATATPYEGVRRVPPGHALILRDGRPRDRRLRADRLARRRRAPADPTARWTASATPSSRPYAPGSPRPGTSPGADIDPGPVPGMGPAERRAARGMPVARHRRRPLRRPRLRRPSRCSPRGCPGMPGTPLGHGTGAGERLLAVTFNDLAVRRRDREAELERAGTIAANPRLHHVVVAGRRGGPPVRRPGRRPAHRRAGPLPGHRGAAPRAGSPPGSADHFIGLRRPAGPRRAPGAPRRPAHGPAAAPPAAPGRRARQGGRPSAHSVLVPCTVYRAARRLARTPYRDRRRSGRRRPAAGRGSFADGRRRPRRAPRRRLARRARLGPAGARRALAHGRGAG